MSRRVLTILLGSYVAIYLLTQAKATSDYLSSRDSAGPSGRVEYANGLLLSFQSQSLDFGEFHADASPEATLTFRNLSSESLQLVSLFPSCSCVSGEIIDGMMKPGEAGSIRVRIIPSLVAESGPFVVTLSLSFEGRDEREVIPIKGILVD